MNRRSLFKATCALSFTITTAFSLSSVIPKNEVRIKNVLKAQSEETNEESSPNSDVNRRGFLSNSAVSAIAFSNMLSPENTLAVETNAVPAMAPRIQLPPMGLGAWAWGDSFFWGYDSKNDADLQQVFQYAVDNQCAFFDTAEVYGFGRSETLLGQFQSQDLSKKTQIATKFAALPWRTKPQAVVDACKNSLQRLGMDQVDLYQIHFPNAWANEEYWDGLAMCYEEGLVKAVGVSNYGVDALKACHGKLKERGIPLQSNQIQCSLLYRWPLENGLLKACKDLDVDILSYSPLALGFLTGKYSKDNLPSGPRKVLGEKLYGGNFGDLENTMKSIASGHADASVSQVALNWARAKGTIPIPGARNLKQAKQNIGALSWSLSDDELKALDDAASKIPSIVAPDASPFPKKDKNTGLIMFDS